jgi:hypothetical protein
MVVIPRPVLARPDIGAIPIVSDSVSTVTFAIGITGMTAELFVTSDPVVS